MLKVVKEQAGPVGEHGEGGVVAHRADGFLSLSRHRQEDGGDVLAGVTKALLQGGESAGHGVGRGLAEEPVHDDAVFLHPAAIGAAAGDVSFDFGVAHHAMRGEVEPNHLAGTEAAAPHNVLRRQVEHAGLGGQHEGAVLAQGITGGTQPIAVEHGAGAQAIGEDDGGGTVPRFHEGRFVFQETADVVAHVVRGTPSLRQEHQHGVRQVAPRADEQFQHVVQTGGVRLSGRDKRQDLGQIVAKEGAGEAGFTGTERGKIAPQGVDLAVVGQEPEGLGEVPRREGVGAVTLVRHGQGGGEVGCAQVLVEGIELMGQKQTLVDNAARGEGAEVKALAQRLFDTAADDEEPTLQIVPATLRRRRNEELADARAARLGGAANGLGMHGHLAPRERREPLIAEDCLEVGLASLTAEDHRHGIDLREVLHAGAEEGVRKREEQSRAVPCLGVPPRRAAVGQAAEHGQPLLDDAVAGAVVEVGHQPHAARVVLKPRVVESLSSGQA